MISLRKSDLFIERYPADEKFPEIKNGIYIIHKPTGIAVCKGDDPIQHINRRKALQVLKDRLRAFYENCKVTAW